MIIHSLEYFNELFGPVATVLYFENLDRHRGF